jgi:hypothetical protein
MKIIADRSSLSFLTVTMALAYGFAVRRSAHG